MLVGLPKHPDLSTPTSASLFTTFSNALRRALPFSQQRVDPLIFHP